MTKREKRYFGRLHERAEILRARLADTQLRHTEEITQELHALDWALMVIAEWDASTQDATATTKSNPPQNSTHS